MHPGRLAEREQAAETRIYSAARRLAAGSDLDGLVQAIEMAHDRDPAVKGMLRKEALADLMEAVATDNTPLEGTEPPTGAPSAVAGRHRGGRPRKEAVNV